MSTYPAAIWMVDECRIKLLYFLQIIFFWGCGFV